MRTGVSFSTALHATSVSHMRVAVGFPMALSNFSIVKLTSVAFMKDVSHTNTVLAVDQSVPRPIRSRIQIKFSLFHSELLNQEVYPAELLYLRPTNITVAR